MFDIITFGSAIRDAFLRLEKGSWRIVKNPTFSSGKAVCFPFGSKMFIEDLTMTTGGGGTNTAVYFAKQGFKTAYCGKLGNDKRGETILKELKDFKVNTGLIKIDKNYPTAYSVILSSGEERTILIQKGACHYMASKDVPWSKLKARCFYLAPLSGTSAKLFGPLVKQAKKNGCFVVANPGNSQLELGFKDLKQILSKIDILILNQEEASLLTNISFNKEKEVFAKLDEMIPGIAVMTKGEKGVLVSDGQFMWKANSFSVPVAEKTGAGDAFASGFVSGFIKTSDIVYSIQLGTANAASCIQEIGAKKGLLLKKSWPKIKVKKIKL